MRCACLGVAIFLLLHSLAGLRHLLRLVLGHVDRRIDRVDRLEFKRAARCGRAFIAHEVVDLRLKVPRMVLLGRVVSLMAMHLGVLGPGDALFLLRLGRRSVIRRRFLGVGRQTEVKLPRVYLFVRMEP